MGESAELEKADRQLLMDANAELDAKPQSLGDDDRFRECISLRLGVYHIAREKANVQLFLRIQVPKPLRCDGKTRGS